MENLDGDRIMSFDELTPTQREVLVLLACGYSRQQVADRLGSSVNTIRNHGQAIYRRIGIRNRVQALRWVLAQPAAAKRFIPLQHMPTEMLGQALEAALDTSTD